ncbi:hypothetical protein NH340_JMT04324 [Sarcoptes scabiei]|nr:hypothetical protein NH340_JMT04324 [Sarcoptes scabiei]
MIQSMNKQFLSRRCNIFGSIRSIHSRTFQQYNCSETYSRFRVIFRTNLRSLSNESVHRLQVRSTFNRKIETIDNVRYPAINQSDNIKSCLNYYCCGPTVYAESHLGHAITYIRSDQIVRTLREFGKQNVCLAMNITDIDDKILQKSKENRRDYRDLAEENFESFMSDMISLRILLPDFIGKVTDHIDMIGDYIRRIYSKGYAYISEETGDVNFDYDAFLADYNIQNEMNFGSGQISSKSFGKRSPKDFVLWKRSKTIDEPRWILKLENVSLEGRPGWHIECSAMINSIFGPKLDVHFGGFDLIFPHHHCEACCSHAFHFDPTDRGDLYSTSKIWLHSGHLIMRSEVSFDSILRIFR